MPEFEIITLSPKDWQRYREIRLEALQTEPRAFAMSYAAALQRTPKDWQERVASFQHGEKSWLLFAQAGGRLVGLVGAYALEELGSAEIIQLYVNLAWRGKGVATALMEAILAALVQSSVRTAVLTVNSEQSAAVALYQKLGFEIAGPAEGVLGDGETYTGYRMERGM